MTKKINLLVVLTGVAVGAAAVLLTAMGNPANMGFCIACFLRDIAGATHLHGAAVVQYVRPEIIGLVLGSTIMAFASGEFRARAGSSPATRFILGAFVMIGALVFLGCPLRMVIRMGGGDLNAIIGLVGFALGILIGVFFLKKNFSTLWISLICKPSCHCKCQSTHLFSHIRFDTLFFRYCFSVCLFHDCRGF